MTHTYMTHNTPSWPTPPLHDPPHPYVTHPTPSHPYMTQVMNPLLHGLPALPQAMGGGFDPSSQEEVLGKNFKIEGKPMCKFLVTSDTFVGLNG